MFDYEKTKAFMTLLHRFHTVDRVAEVPTLARQTNAVEHSYQLAMLAWYTVMTQNLPLDLEKVLKYALAHDLVEAYAGDTPVADAEGQKTKKAREAAAFTKLKEQFSEFGELLSILKAYEARTDEESKFVYALDKCVDPLNAVMITDREPYWKKYNVPYEMHRAYKDPRTAVSGYVANLWSALSEELRDKKDFFFPS
jgi:putative hydrolase of HD superfamily